MERPLPPLLPDDKWEMKIKQVEEVEEEAVKSMAMRVGITELEMLRNLSVSHPLGIEPMSLIGGSTLPYRQPERKMPLLFTTSPIIMQKLPKLHGSYLPKVEVTT